MNKADEYMRKSESDDLGTAGRLVLTSILRHENEQHGNGFCMETRIHAVAYIAHNLGLAADDDNAWEYARLIVKDIYEHGFHE